MTRHMTLEDMTADCKQLSDIKALHGRRADRLHHETEIHGTIISSGSAWTGISHTSQ